MDLYEGHIKESLTDSMILDQKKNFFSKSIFFIASIKDFFGENLSNFFFGSQSGSQRLRSETYAARSLWQYK